MGAGVPEALAGALPEPEAPGPQPGGVGWGRGEGGQGGQRGHRAGDGEAAGSPARPGRMGALGISTASNPGGAPAAGRPPLGPPMPPSGGAAPALGPWDPLRTTGVAPTPMSSLGRLQGPPSATFPSPAACCPRPVSPLHGPPQHSGPGPPGCRLPSRRGPSPCPPAAPTKSHSASWQAARCSGAPCARVRGPGAGMPRTPEAGPSDSMAGAHLHPRRSHGSLWTRALRPSHPWRPRRRQRVPLAPFDRRTTMSPPNPLHTHP